jgi:hypothetical protein
VAAVILRWVENANKQKTDFDGAITLQPLESTLVVNLFFLVTFLVVKAFKRRPASLELHAAIPEQSIPVISSWIIWINFLFFIVQIYYFFFTS